MNSIVEQKKNVEKKKEICEEILYSVFEKLCGKNAIEIIENIEGFENDKSIKDIQIEELANEKVCIYFKLKEERALLWDFFIRPVFMDNILTSLSYIDEQEVPLLKHSIYCSVVSYFKEYLKENMFIDVEDVIALSAMYYEGSQANGNIYLFSADTPEYIVEFENNSICLNNDNYRKIRKYMEMTYEEKSAEKLTRIGLAFLYDGKWKLKGLVEKKKNAVHIRFIKHMVWEMYWNDTAVIRYNCGCYESPVSVEGYKNEFVEKHIEAVGEDEKLKADANINKLWECIRAAIGQKHGTIVIIFYGEQGDVKSEVESLAGSAPEKRIKQIRLAEDSDVLGRLMVIDGALLIDQAGTPYASGLILDSTVKSSELKLDSGRGSRYNSAKKYIFSLYKREKIAMAVIVSEDGMVNFYSTKDAERESKYEQY